MTSTEVMRVPNAELGQRVSQLFEHVGVPPDQASTIAEVLTLADMRGLESHGVRFAPRYLRGLARGYLNPKPRLRWLKEVGATAVLDADNALGFVAARAGMERAIELAGHHGIGTVAIRNSNHFGIAGYYPLMATDMGMIGYATTDGPPHTVLWGGRRAMVCNNPIAWGFPTRVPPAILVDTALTGVKEKIRLAAERGETIPSDWAVGPDGAPTTDPGLALKGALLPIGGPKGSALIVAGELLAGALAGARFSYEISPALVQGADHHDCWSCGHLVMALDVAAFSDREAYLARVDEFVAAVRSAEPAPGCDRLYLPGEREWLHEQESRRLGTPVSLASLRALDEVAKELGTTVDFEGLARVHGRPLEAKSQ